MHLSRQVVLLVALCLLAGCAEFRAAREAPSHAPPGTKSDEPRLTIAEAQLNAGDLAQARATLDRIDDAQLTGAQRTYRRILEAELALAEGQPLDALRVLPVTGAVREPGYAARVEELRARALFRMGDVVGGTEVLLARGRASSDASFNLHNRDLLWSELQQADLDAVVPQRLQRTDPLTRGWIELAAISRGVWTPPQTLSNRLEEWQTQYPQHPGNELLGDIAVAAVPARSVGGTVALLLPMTGPFAATGQAVRDGFLSAYYEIPDALMTVRAYDTGDTIASFQFAMQQAINDGAQFVVGPLRRDMVNALAAGDRPPVPVLALNYLDPGMPAPFNLYQWGLAPEDEARQAAERAIADGQFRAIALVPEGDWGLRILAAFRERYEMLGGKVIADSTYQPTERDHSEEIRKLLALDWSEERHRTLTIALGTKTEFEPRRRADVDLIFMAARTDQARQLGPQLRFHRSGGLPTYATAAIYDGTPPAMDLNGLRFCDMPWMLASAGAADERWAMERARLATLFPQHGNDYARLLSLGRDAFSLVSLIKGGQLRPGSYFPAASGTLSLDNTGVIRRRLSCVEIDKGALVPLDAAPLVQ